MMNVRPKYALLVDRKLTRAGSAANQRKIRSLSSGKKIQEQSIALNVPSRSINMKDAII